jgi:histidine triad (HIT) family protein
MSEKTIFEMIAAHEIPAEIVYEDEHTVAFLDIKPTNHGHTLVIPRTAYRNILETPDEETAHIMSTVKKVAKAVREGLGAQGVNVVFNNETAAGQDVFHTHAHVIPRFEGDGLRGWEQHAYPDENKMREVAEKLRIALS